MFIVARAYWGYAWGKLGLSPGVVCNAGLRVSVGVGVGYMCPWLAIGSGHTPAIATLNRVTVRVTLKSKVSVTISVTITY